MKAYLLLGFMLGISMVWMGCGVQEGDPKTQTVVFLDIRPGSIKNYIKPKPLPDNPAVPELSIQLAPLRPDGYSDDRDKMYHPSSALPYYIVSNFEGPRKIIHRLVHYQLVDWGYEACVIKEQTGTWARDYSGISGGYYGPGLSPEVSIKTDRGRKERCKYTFVPFISNKERFPLLSIQVLMETKQEAQEFLLAEKVISLADFDFTIH